MNVLITSAGRRTSLLCAFKEAVHKRNGKLLAGDVDSLAPTMYMADIPVRLPRIDSETYIDQLMEIVEQYEVRLIVPTIDTELPVLAKYSDLFARLDCKLLISRYELIEVADDKWKTVNTFKNRGIKTPASWLPEDLDDLHNVPEELFVKPRNGSASKNTCKIKKSELKNTITFVPNPIIQEFIPYPEVTIDALISISGEIIHYVPRRRIKTIGGESIQGVTIPDDGLREWILEVLRNVSELGGKGPITLQAFLTPAGPVLSEINPRFGGGIPLTLAAGGNYPEWIIQMLEGCKVEPRIGLYKRNLYMTRYYSELFFENPLWEVNLG